MPLGVSAMRGVARPERGSSMMLLVTTAPMDVMSKNWSSSRPEAAHPEAVRTGLGSPTEPRRVDISMLGTTAADVPWRTTARVIGLSPR